MQVQHSLKSPPPSPTPLEAPPLLPTCCLFSSHTDLLILVALNTPSAPGPLHKLFPLSLFLLNFHSSFRSLLRHHFLGEAFLGISEQDKFLHYMESWLHASCLEHCDCYNFKLPCLVFLVIVLPLRAGLHLLCLPQQLPQCPVRGDSHGMLLYKNKSLY